MRRCAVAMALSLCGATAWAEAPLTTAIRATEPDRTEVLRALLSSPERVVELALTPVALLVRATEAHRLDRRFIDLISNDEETIWLLPRVELSGRDGIGSGAVLWFRSLFGDDEDLKMGGLRHLNGDFEVEARYVDDLPWLEGRALDVSVGFEANKNAHFYGVGADSPVEDLRVLSEEVLEARVRLDVFPAGSMTVSGEVELGLTKSLLGAGQEAGVLPVPGDLCAPERCDHVLSPADFGAQEYAHGGVTFRYDSRDNEGRPTRGLLAELSGGLVTSISEQIHDDRYAPALSAATAHAELTGYLQVRPRKRVLLLRVGAGVARPLMDGDAVPLRHLVTLGRDTGLRGYDKNRLLGELGWWSTVEYQFPIYEYMSSGLALSAAFFVDAGRVGDTLDELWDDKIYPSVGGGLWIAHDMAPILGLQLGASDEGTELVFSAGGQL